MMHFDVRSESWEIDGTFTITRGTRTHAPVVVVTLQDGAHRGWGEGAGVPYHGETPASMAAQLEAVRSVVEQGVTRAEVQDLLPAGGARAALDAALWDLEAKRTGTPVWRLAGLAAPETVTTAYTISLADPAVMAEKAAGRRDQPVLKIKLGDSAGDLDRIRAVRAAVPEARLIIDANEGWTYDDLLAFVPTLAEVGVELVEQPLPAGADAALAAYDGPVPLCADETCQTAASLADLAAGYAFVNVKLDKTGGLTEALRLADAAEARGLGLMVGCMLGTSLGMAPAALVAARCRFVDLDGPLLLRDDRVPAIRYEHGRMYPPPRDLWG